MAVAVSRSAFDGADDAGDSVEDGGPVPGFGAGQGETHYQYRGDFAAGKAGTMRLLMGVRDLRNRRHESAEGKFEIDRAVDRALQALEDKSRTGGRKPSSRTIRKHSDLPPR